jgi:hypothetical protein
MRAPGEGDFSISNFHPGLIPGNLAKTIFGVREVAGRGRGWPVLGYLLGKKLSAARPRSCSASCRTEVVGFDEQIFGEE